MSKWVKTKIFPKKVAKKQLFWGTQIRINWLWGGLTPIFLKVSLTSTCVLKKLEHNLRNELCARRQSSIVSDWRPLENYFESDTEKCKKRFFWFSSNYLRFWYRNTYPGYHHVKANVLTIPKMWWFLGLRVFERELSLLKVGTLPKFWVRYQK